MKLLLTIFMLLIALGLAPFAWDWRSPFLVDMRPWLLKGLIAAPVILILGQICLLLVSRRDQRLLRVLSALGLAAALAVVTTTLILEARFHWVRHQVLQTDPKELEKVGRHLIVGYHDLAEVRELVKHRAIAGVFVTSRNVNRKTVAEIRQEIRSLQNERQQQGLPRLWIATDQEGGIVSRLSPPLTRLPALSEIVELHPNADKLQQAVREFGANQGRELADIGVNLNFAPVVDVNHQIVNPDDYYSRIYQRAISCDPAIVAQVASWYCAALEEAGVRCTLKHFPGLGRVFEDTHLNHASLSTPLAELTNTDLLPFRIVLQGSAAFTMLGHVRLTAVDSERPVSLSAPVIAGMLRGEWKHDGVLITDNFSMLAVYRSAAGIDNGSIEALNAGVDLILISYDPDQYYRVMYALLQANRQGRLTREALERSDQRLARAIESVRR